MRGMELGLPGRQELLVGKMEPVSFFSCHLCPSPVMSSLPSIPPGAVGLQTSNHIPTLRGLCCFPARVQGGEVTCAELQPQSS